MILLDSDHLTFTRLGFFCAGRIGMAMSSPVPSGLELAVCRKKEKVHHELSR